MNKPITLFELLEVAHDGADADLDAHIYGECADVGSMLMGISARIVDHHLVINFVPMPAGGTEPRG